MKIFYRTINTFVRIIVNLRNVKIFLTMLRLSFTLYLLIIIKTYTQDGKFRLTRNFYKNSATCSICDTSFPGGAKARYFFKCPCCRNEHCVICALKRGLRPNKIDFTYLNFGYYFRKYHKCPFCKRCVNVGNGDYVIVPY